VRTGVRTTRASPRSRGNRRGAIYSASICSILGAAAPAYLTELTHRRPQIWINDVDRLHELLQTHSDAAVRRAFERGLAEQAIGAGCVAHYLGDSCAS